MKKKITEEDFDAWRSNAVTQFVFAHLADVQARAIGSWSEILLQDLPIDPVVLRLHQVELKSKVEFIQDILELKLGDILDDAASDERASARH